ncbi:MAG TPA: glycosyltransferase [Bryobacteraceae bacterium]|nr:glycosyltransferase [Bryobacteraceae bacterium]
MRILYFSSRECWPPNTGARLRDYHFVRQLATRARVTYLGLRNPADPPPTSIPADTGLERSALADKDPNFSPGKLIRGLIGPEPITVLNNCSPRIAAELSRTVSEGEGFDSVQVEGVHLVSYIPLLRAAPRKPLVIADWHNIESEIMWRYSEKTSFARRLYAHRTAKLIEDMELRLLRECDVHVVTSSRERDILRKRLPAARIEIVGNGVDVPYFANAALDPVGAGRRDILFVGSMDYHANIEAALEFARDVWPTLRASHPDFRFVIVGRNPPRQVRDLAAQPGVIVTGTVDDVRPWYCAAFAVVVPLRTGSGTRLKILEAMATGVPVVSTRLGAEGLNIQDGENILLAETAGEMRQAIDLLSHSPERWQGLAAAGRTLVEREYDWKSLGRRLFEIHKMGHR